MLGMILHMTLKTRDKDIMLKMEYGHFNILNQVDGGGDMDLIQQNRLMINGLQI